MSKTTSLRRAPDAPTGLLRVWHLMGADRPRMAAAMVYRLLQSMAQGMAYGVALWVIRELAVGTPMTVAWVRQITALMALSVALQLLFSYLSVREAWQVSYQISGKLRLRVLAHLRAVPLGFHLARQKGDLANTILTDVAMVESFTSDGLGRVVQAFGLPLTILAVMAWMDWRLALAMGLTIALSLPITAGMGRHLAAQGLKRQDQQAEASSRMIEFVLGMKVIRAFGSVDVGTDRFKDAIAQFRDISITMVTRFVTPIMVFISVLMLGIAATFFATGKLLSGLEPGVAISALVLGFAIYSPIVALVSATEMVRMAEASLRRIDRVLQAAPMRAPANGPRPEGFALAFRNVRFDYGTGHDLIKGLSFDVPERSMTAIVGPSGAGKTTVLNLIARFWDPSSGEILLGGVPLAELPAGALMDHISFVFQDVYLFAGTVADNIRLGRPDATDAEVINAAKLARAHDFITDLAQGYATDTGEGGTRLSGGERQRIAIARAILKDAPIVLLDEATAAIDPINERAIQEALGALIKDRTLIVVAHKLSTIEAADQILVMEEGQIVERGQHDELLARGGLYTRLFNRKTKADSWTL